jgi:hypothetical protein
MLRLLTASALILGVMQTPALAKMDCSKEFRVRVDRMMSQGDTVPTKQMIYTTRFLLKGYDACMKGDTETARDFFEKTTRHGS